MGKKIIFLDIDGTLTEPGSNEPPESAADAVRKAREKGNYVFLCTGRNYGMLRPLLKYGFDGVVASSGGYIRCGENVVYDCPFTEAQKEKLLDVLEKSGIYRTVECVDGSYTDESFKEFLQANVKAGSNSEALRWRKQIEESLNILPMEQYQGQPVYKVVAMCEKESQLEEIRKIFGKEMEICIQGSDEFGYTNGEIISREFNKGKGVERVCDFLHIPLEDTVGFGDSLNDKDMIQTVALGICMDGGDKRLQKIADDICSAVDQDGIYRFFEKYHLM